MPGEITESGFQTKTVLRTLLTEAGLSPRRQLGQHFLIDRNLMQKLVDAADLGPADCVLEVGAGTGSLTGVLARLAARLVAVEIDPDLVRIVAERLAPLLNARLIHGDALQNKSTVSPEVIAALRQAHAETGGGLKLVANLPYDIATPLVVDLLLCDLPFGRLCFTVQNEVADRFLAEPDTADYGPVGIITQVLCRGRRICRVPPQAFWPPPKVSSAMVRLDRRPAGEIEVSNPTEFAAFVRSFFQHRRKMIGHLARQRPESERVLQALARAGVRPEARPENLSVREWVEFYRAAT